MIIFNILLESFKYQAFSVVIVSGLKFSGYFIVFVADFIEFIEFTIYTELYKNRLKI